MTVGTVLQIGKEAVICDSGSRDLAGVTLNSSKIVFYEFVSHPVPLLFKTRTILKTTTLFEEQIGRITCV